MSHDQIHIRDLLLRGLIGINDWEREKPQDILLNITLFANLQAAGKSDEIEDTVNYRTLTKQIIAHIESSARFTIEALAEDVAQICLADSRVVRVRVRIEKPGALRFAKSVGVDIERPAT